LSVNSVEPRRLVLGAFAALSEAEVHWRSFLVTLKERGVGIPDSITSDAHEGIRGDRAVFNATAQAALPVPSTATAQAYVPKLGMREDVAADIRFQCRHARTRRS
jgi:putative transposase